MRRSSSQGSGREIKGGRERGVLFQRIAPCPACVGRGTLIDEHREACAGRGDLLVRLRVVVPEQLSAAQRELFERLRQLERHRS